MAIGALGSESEASNLAANNTIDSIRNASTIMWRDETRESSQLPSPAADLEFTEDRQPGQPLDIGDASSILGVSISQAQAHILSPETPAAEKAAALEEGEKSFPFELPDTPIKEETSTPDEQVKYADLGSDILERQDAIQLDGPHESDGISVGREDGPLKTPKILTSGEIRRQSLEDLPSPWRAPESAHEAPDGRRSMMEAFKSGRKRASTMGSALLGEDSSFRKYLPNISKNMNAGGLPFSLPQFRIISTQNSALSGQRGDQLGKPSPRSSETNGMSSPGSNGPNDVPADSPPYRSHRSTLSVPEANLSLHGHSAHHQSMQLPVSHTRADSDRTLMDRTDRRSASSLRRSNSDGSLALTHALSRVSSLGDDSRFEHVQDQVNSRFKAIRDSFADSSFKMPRMPTIASVSLSSLKLPDLNSNPKPKNVMGGLAMSSLVADPAAPRVVPQAEPAVLSQVTPTTDQFKFLNNALNDLTGDVVIMGGYRGSILRSAQPPHRQLWIPVKVGLNLRKVDLEVGLKPEDEEKMHESIIPSGMLTHIGPIDISRRLIKKLRACENARNGKLRVWEYGYDWRLSPHLLSRKLISALENLPSNRKGTPLQDSGALIIAHSLGGLITRHVINQRPELVSGVLYAGVPQHCVNILGPLRNGDEVLLSSKVLTAQVNFTIRTSFALLPEDGSCFLDKTTKEAYRVNFFDANTWIENRLSPCVAAPLPPLSKTTSGLGSLVEAVSGGLPKLPLRATWKLQDAADEKDGDSLDPIEPRMNGHGNAAIGKDPSSSSSSSVSTVCTLPRDEAIAYLRRTLAETLKFKQELVVRPELRETNAYPPIAVLYGKTVPTVYGAKVDGREGIKRADAYDRLAFASGDGVCLARAAMVPEGYETVPNGRISSDRGHVNLLGDLEGVGRAIKAIQAGRRRGIGLGKK